MEREVEREVEQEVEQEVGQEVEQEVEREKINGQTENGQTLREIDVEIERGAVEMVSGSNAEELAADPECLTTDESAIADGRVTDGDAGDEQPAAGKGPRSIQDLPMLSHMGKFLPLLLHTRPTHSLQAHISVWRPISQPRGPNLSLEAQIPRD